MDKELMEILEKEFLSGDEDFDNKHIRPRLLQAHTAIQEHYLKILPKKTFDHQKEGDNWCEQAAELVTNDVISEMESKIRGDVK